MCAATGTGEGDPDPVGISPIKLNNGGRRGWSLRNTGKISMELPLLSSYFVGIIRIEP